MDKYILEYTRFKEEIASLDISILESKEIDIESKKLSLRLINNWIRDVTNNQVILAYITIEKLKIGITHGIYFIKLYDTYNLRILKTSGNLSIIESKK